MKLLQRLRFYSSDGSSFSGKTRGFEPRFVGSIPTLPANLCTKQFEYMGSSPVIVVGLLGHWDGRLISMNPSNGIYGGSVGLPLSGDLEL